MIQFFQQFGEKQLNNGSNEVINIEIRNIINKNLLNQGLIPLISDPQFIEKVNFQLKEEEQIQFFIKNIFETIRDPSQAQYQLLKSYQNKCCNSSLKKVIEYIVVKFEERNSNINIQIDLIQILSMMQSYEKFVNSRLSILSILTKYSQEQRNLVLPLIKLCEYSQIDKWLRPNFGADLLQLAIRSIQQVCLTKDKKLLETYFQVLSAILMFELISNKPNKINILIFVVTLGEETHKNCPLLLLNIERMKIKMEKKDQIKFLEASHYFMDYFATVFRIVNQFNDKNKDQFRILFRLCKLIYLQMNKYVKFENMGLISLFSLEEWINQNYHLKKDQKQLASELKKMFAKVRQQHQNDSQMVSEAIIIVLLKLETQNVQGWSQLEMILSNLTLCELKYFCLKFCDSTDQVKLLSLFNFIIDSKSKYLKVLAYNIYHKLQDSFDKKLKQRWIIYLEKDNDNFDEIIKQIQISKYSSLWKQEEYLQFISLQFVLVELVGKKLPALCKLEQIISFCKELLKQDRLIQNQWKNRQIVQIIAYHCQPEINDAILALFNIEANNQHNFSIQLIINKILQFNQKKQQKLSIFSQTFLRNKFEVICQQYKQIDALLYYNSIQFVYYLFRYFKNQQEQKNLVLLFTQSQLFKYSAIDKKNFSKQNFMEEYVRLWVLKCENALNVQNLVHLPFYKEYIYNKKFFSPKVDSILISKFIKVYSEYSLLPNNFVFREALQNTKIKQLICRKMSPKYFKECISVICNSFKFQTAIFRGDYVLLQYIKNSPEDSNYIKNHLICFLFQEYVKLFMSVINCSISKSQGLKKEYIQIIFDTTIRLIQEVRKSQIMVLNHGFYQNLIKLQVLYNIATNEFVSVLSIDQLNQIIQTLLSIIQRDTYPLLRQYVEVVLCRCYLQFNKRVPNNQMRRTLVERLSFNINQSVPIALILGYQLINKCEKSQNTADQSFDLHSIHQTLLKFITCHTAYLRGICQYYLYLYVRKIKTEDKFLNNICQFWEQDSDSVKMLKNIAVIVQGFKQAVEAQQHFLGFERIEEYPSNRVKLQFFACAAKLYAERIVDEIYCQDQQFQIQFKTDIQEIVKTRYEHFKNCYLQELQQFINHKDLRHTKSNNQHKVKTQNIQPKQVNKNKAGNKNKKKIPSDQSNLPAKLLIEQKRINNWKQFQEMSSQIVAIEQIKNLSFWYRMDLNPDIIIISTLLEKVHNFGHILRTVNGMNAMIVVPSNMPLQHEECLELVPENFDAQIVEIKPRDLQKFIILQKELGYPLVALEQCSRSVSLQKVVFPKKFMLLLGNERIGAPASLLNLGDILIQIPQLGKVRSLNVHVSMAICLWEFIK